MVENLQDHSNALQMLDSPQLAVRKAAIRYIQQHRVREAVPLMLDMLLNDPESVIRVGVIRTLCDLGAREVIPYLFDLLQLDPDIDVRMVTLSTLGKLKARQAIPLMLELFLQPETPENLMQMSLWALKELNDRKTYANLAQLLLAPHLSPHMQSILIRVLEDTRSLGELVMVWPATDLAVAQQIETTLRRYDLHTCLQEMLLSAHEADVLAALNAFEKLKVLSVLPAWLRGYSQWPEPLRQRAQHGLQPLATATALNEQFADLAPDEQKTALHIIQQLQLKKCLPMLLLQLPLVSRSMVQAIQPVLQEIGLTQFLSQTFKKNMEPDPLFIKALGVLRLHEALPYLLKIYAHASDPLRKITILQALKHLKATSYLLQVAGSEQHPHRWQALDILENLSVTNIAGQLVPLATDPVAAIANKALHILQGFKAREQIPALIENTHCISPQLWPALWQLFKSLQPGPIFLSLLKESHDNQFMLNLLQAIEALELKETAPELAKITLRGPLPIQLRCIEILVGFHAREVLSDLLPLVGTNHPRLRRTFKEMLQQLSAEPLLLHWAATAPLREQVASIYCIRLLHLTSAIPVLLRLLMNAVPSIQALLRAVLLELQPQQVILKQLSEGSPKDQSICLHALQELELIELLPDLWPYYLALEAPQQQAFLQVIDHLGARPMTAAALNSLDFDDQVNALAILEALKAHEYIPAIMAFMVEHDGAVREKASQAFRALNGFQHIEQLLVNQAEDADFYQLLTDLGNAWDHPGLIGPLIQVVLQAPPPLQEQALNALRKQDAIPEVIKTLAAVPPQVQLHGIQALGHLGAFATIPMTIQHLKNAEPQIQSEAVRILRKLNAREAIPELMSLLVKSQNQALQETLQETLHGFQVVQAVIPNMLQSHDPEERSLALQSIVILDKNKAKTLVIESLRDPKAEIRMLALKLMQQYELQEASAWWIKSLRDIQPLVKETALRLLVSADPQKGLQYILDEFFIAPKPPLPSYQKSLLEMLLSLPVPLINPRLLPLLDNPGHAERFEKALQPFLAAVLPQKPESLHFCFYYLVHYPQTAISQLIWNTLPQVRSLVRIFLYNRATMVFHETPGFQALLQLMLRFSRLTTKEMRYFYQLCDRPFNVKFYLYLISVLYKRLSRLLEHHPPGILSEADLESLHFVFMEALNMAEDKYPRTLSQYRRYLIAVQKWRHLGQDNIIPLHGGMIKEMRPPSA